MSPLMIVITIAIVVLIFIILRFLLINPYTLQGLQSGQTMSTINSSSLATSGSGSSASNFAYSVWFYIDDFNEIFNQQENCFFLSFLLSFTRLYNQIK